MTKVVGLIRPNAQQIYFANQLHQTHPFDLLVIECRERKGLRKLITDYKTKNSLGNRFSNESRFDFSVKDKTMVNIYDGVFGDDWCQLDAGIPIMVVPDINSQVVEDKLNTIKPDLMLVHGTGIVKDHIIDCAKTSVNLHWGLSPYYRGTHCTEWALINWDPFNIGVTLHELTKAIDGGGVLSQQRIDVVASDTIDSINMKLTYAGVELLKNVLTKFSQGEGFNFIKQDHSQGYLTLNKQWTKLLREQVKRLTESGSLQKILSSPARKEKLTITEI